MRRSRFLLSCAAGAAAILAACGGGSGDSDETPVPTKAASVAPSSPTSTSNATQVSSQTTPTVTATTGTQPTQAAATPTTAPATAAPTSSGGGTTQPTATPVPQQSGNPMSATMGAAESGNNFRWSPSLVTIAPGGTVTFAWSGGSAHDVSVAGIFESPKATTEASYPVAFPSAGEFTVRCIIHPAMVGKVVVK